MIIQKGIPNENLRKGYWFRASNEHIYIVELKTRHDKDDRLTNVIATVYEPDCNSIDDDIDITKFSKGEEVEYCWMFSDDDWIMNIDIWGKYYFPTFNEEQNQWYHRMERDKDVTIDMDDFTFILKETYKIAMKVSGLKTY